MLGSRECASKQGNMLRLKAINGIQSRTDPCSLTWHFLLASQDREILAAKSVEEKSVPLVPPSAKIHVEIALTDSPENQLGSALPTWLSQEDGGNL